MPSKQAYTTWKIFARVYANNYHKLKALRTKSLKLYCNVRLFTGFKHLISHPA